MPKTLSDSAEVVPAKRRALVLELVRRAGVVSVQDLATEIQASPSTIRRDLEYLTSEGGLIRTHGGAVSMSEPSSTFELDQTLNSLVSGPEKAAIGMEAAKRLKSGESVIFDSSSTVFCAAEAAIGRGLEITAVTNSFDIGRIASTAPAWRVYMLGGLVRPNSPTIVGESAENALASVHADVTLMGCYAITGAVLTDPSPEIASLKRRMIKAARRVILLADSTKFRLPAFSEFCKTDQISEIITDDRAPRDAIEGLRSAGVELTVVPAGNRELK